MSVIQKSAGVDIRRVGQLGWRAGLMSSVALALVAVPSLAWAQDTGRSATSAAARAQGLDPEGALRRHADGVRQAVEKLASAPGSA